MNCILCKKTSNLNKTTLKDAHMQSSSQVLLLPDSVVFCSSHCACAWEAWGRPCCFSNSSSILTLPSQPKQGARKSPSWTANNRGKKASGLARFHYFKKEQRNSSVAFDTSVYAVKIRWCVFLILAWEESEGPVTYICSTIVRQGECTMLRCQMFATDLKPGHLSCIAWFSPSRSYIFVALHLKLCYYIYQLCTYNPVYTDDAL